MQDQSQAKVPARKVQAEVPASPRPRPRAKPKPAHPKMPKILVRWCVTTAVTKDITQTNAPSQRRREAMPDPRLQIPHGHLHHLRAAEAHPTEAQAVKVDL